MRLAPARGGVPIPVFIARSVTRVADPAVINHVADIFERESGDAWYTHEASELLPPGYTQRMRRRRVDQRERHSRRLVRQRVSSIAVLESREELRWPATSTSRAAISFAAGSILR